MSWSFRSQQAAKTVISRFRRNESGTAAVEFAFVAPIFFTLLFAIIGMGMFFLAGQTLENAAQDTSRLIMTGQVQTAQYTQTQFKTAVCSRVVALFDCQGGLAVDVRSYRSFADVTFDNPIGPDNKLRNDFVYQPGNQGDVVVVRVFYQWPLYVPALYGSFSTNGWSNARLMTASAIFRNEPF